jgi:5-formaminoimidazole-4-carboxamide-1-(beta)-D-ribofuranosyl 5'-monophosphate synthetase
MPRKKARKKAKKTVFGHLLKGVQIEVKKVSDNAKEETDFAFGKFQEIKEKLFRVTAATRIPEILENYDRSNISIGVLGGHSALDVCRGAKKQGFRTVAVCQKGREQTYAKYYKSRDDGRGIIDEIILVDKFSDIVKKEVQERLRTLNTIFIHNRYFWVYCNFNDIEKKFKVPIFGTRTMVKLEERDVEKNQYYLLQKAHIRLPKIYGDPKKIDKLVIVKVAERQRGYERAFFFCNNYSTYQKKSKEMLDKKIITPDALKKAVIEEYIIGAQVNFNYFYSPLTEELELMGTDTRRQTNLDGLLRLPADSQLEVLNYLKPKLIETGHIAVTTKESILEKIFRIGEQFVESCKKEHPPGIIGPFALQGAVAAEEGREELVIFDVSMRIPGSPGTISTPYSSYLHHESISYGERIAMEIRKAIEEDKLDWICT